MKEIMEVLSSSEFYIVYGLIFVMIVLAIMIIMAGRKNGNEEIEEEEAPAKTKAVVNEAKRKHDEVKSIVIENETPDEKRIDQVKVEPVTIKKEDNEKEIEKIKEVKENSRTSVKEELKESSEVDSVQVEPMLHSSINYEPKSPKVEFDPEQFERFRKRALLDIELKPHHFEELRQSEVSKSTNRADLYEELRRETHIDREKETKLDTDAVREPRQFEKFRRPEPLKMDQEVNLYEESNQNHGALRSTRNVEQYEEFRRRVPINKEANKELELETELEIEREELATIDKEIPMRKPVDEIPRIINTKMEEPVPEPEDPEEHIIYADEDMSKTEAQLELQRLTEELSKAEAKKDPIVLTNFELEQEENAIISYNELVKRVNELYNKNEKTQYLDEGMEPINFEELEAKFKKIEEPSTVQLESFMEEQLVAPKEREVATRVDEAKKFKSSPVISPIFGLEKEPEKREVKIELEQTADLAKYDEEIRKTNEFLRTLKELQKKLD